MPNYVANRLVIKGLSKMDLFITDKNGKRHFDFNKLIKMPRSLEMQDGSMTDKAVAAALQKICRLYFKEHRWSDKDVTVLVKERFFKEEEREKYEKEGYKYILNMIKYGYPTWYGWRYANWNTKWNASDTVFVNDDEIRFDTAWANPEPVIKKIAEKYPGIEIFHEWSDEDYGENCGERTYDGHTWTETYDIGGSDEAIDRYNRLHGDYDEE